MENSKFKANPKHVYCKNLVLADRHWEICTRKRTANITSDNNNLYLLVIIDPFSRQNG